MRENTLFINKNIFEESPMKYAEKVINTNISIPAFQRNYVWSKKPKKILDIIESIYQGFNLGTVVFWKSKIKGISRKEENIMNQNEDFERLEYVVDGQQRTLTLVSLLTDFNIVNLDLHSIYIQYNTNKGRLTFSNSPDAAYPKISFAEFKEGILKENNGDFDVDDFFKGTAWSAEVLNNFKYELEEKLKRNIKSAEIVVGYRLQINASDLNLAIKQFEKINKTGIPLSEMDILDSLAFSDNKYEMKSFIPKLEKEKFGGLIVGKKFSSDLQKIVLNSYKLIKNFETTSSVSLSSEAVSNFESGDTKIIDNAFKHLFNFLSEVNKLNINDMKDIPYTHNAVLYIFTKYWMDKNKISTFGYRTEKEFIFYIMFMTGIQRSYEKSATAKLISHIKKVIQQIQDNERVKLQDEEFFEISTADIMNSNYEKISAFEKAIFIYWINNLEIRDYISDTKISLMGVFKNKENLDHIFPRAIYEDGVGKRINSLANIALVLEGTNKSKNDKKPCEYFSKINYRERYLSFKSQLISEEAFDDLLEDNWSAFLNKRTKEICNTINEYMEKEK